MEKIFSSNNKVDHNYLYIHYNQIRKYVNIYVIFHVSRVFLGSPYKVFIYNTYFTYILYFTCNTFYRFHTSTRSCVHASIHLCVHASIRPCVHASICGHSKSILLAFLPKLDSGKYPCVAGCRLLKYCSLY